MKAPLFWYQPHGFLSTLLWPLGWIYGKGSQSFRALKTPERFPVPVLSVGNIVCGGAGKTPTAIALAQLFQTRGVNVHFVTRGYGGIQKGPIAVNPSFHTPLEVGDEPLLLAKHAPTWVAKKRPQGVQKAIEGGANLVLLDDGHQTTSLYKDLSFVVVDLLQGFGNRRVMPAGPLREGLAKGLSRSDAIIGIGEGEIPSSQPFFRARMIPHPLTLPSNRVVAFCGLGFPQKFYNSLKDLSIDLIATETFPDHYKYTKIDLNRLHTLARDHQAVLVTTRKDMVKIPPSWQKHIHVLDISIQFEDPEGVLDFILQKIPSIISQLLSPHPPLRGDLSHKGRGDLSAGCVTSPKGRGDLDAGCVTSPKGRGDLDAGCVTSPKGRGDLDAGCVTSPLVGEVAAERRVRGKLNKVRL